MEVCDWITLFSMDRFEPPTREQTSFRDVGNFGSNRHVYPPVQDRVHGCRIKTDIYTSTFSTNQRVALSYHGFVPSCNGKDQVCKLFRKEIASQVIPNRLLVPFIGFDWSVMMTVLSMMISISRKSNQTTFPEFRGRLRYSNLSSNPDRNYYARQIDYRARPNASFSKISDFFCC